MHSTVLEVQKMSFTLAGKIMALAIFSKILYGLWESKKLNTSTFPFKKKACGDGIYKVKVGHFLDHIHDSHRMPMKYSSVKLIRKKSQP